MSTNHRRGRACLSKEQQATERSRRTSIPKHGAGSDINCLPRHSWTWSIAIEHNQHELQILVVDYKSKQVLLRREGERWVLPGSWVHYEEFEKIEEPSTAVGQVKELTGITNATAFLRSLWRKEMEVRIDDAICTLEKHVMLFETERDAGMNRYGYEWINLRDADVYHLFDNAASVVREAIQCALKDYPSDKFPAWQRPGWLGFATSWMEDVLSTRCNVRLKQPIYVQCSSAYGVVLRAETGKGRFFFKCSLPLANDAAYTDTLSGIVPRGGKKMSRDYARLQKGTINRTDELIEAGFPDLRPIKLLKYIDDLPSDATFRAIGDIEEYAPFIKFFCENKEGSKNLLKKLIESDMPATVTHNDVALRNVYQPVGTDKYMFFDWVEGFLGHPFTSAPLGIQKEAFLEEWNGDCDLGVEKLRELLVVGSCVSSLAVLILRLREANASESVHANRCLEEGGTALEFYKYDFRQLQGDVRQ